MIRVAVILAVVALAGLGGCARTRATEGPIDLRSLRAVQVGGATSTEPARLAIAAITPTADARAAGPAQVLVDLPFVSEFFAQRRFMFVESRVGSEDRSRELFPAIDRWLLVLSDDWQRVYLIYGRSDVIDEKDWPLATAAVTEQYLHSGGSEHWSAVSADSTPAEFAAAARAGLREFSQLSRAREVLAVPVIATTQTWPGPRNEAVWSIDCRALPVVREEIVPPRGANWPAELTDGMRNACNHLRMVVRASDRAVLHATSTPDGEGS